MGAVNSASFFYLSPKKNIMSISRNPFNESARDLLKFDSEERGIKASLKTFEHRPHYQRYKGAYYAAKIMIFVCGLLSALTASMYFCTQLYNSLSPYSSAGAFGLSIVAGVIIVFLIEAMKRSSTKETLINIIQYKTVDGYIFLAIFCLGISVFSSYKGSEIIPEMTTQKPLLVSLDSARSSFENKISKLTALYTYKKTNTLIEEGREALKVLEAEKAHELRRLDSLNKIRAEQYDSTKVESKYNLVAVALVVELFYLIAFIYSLNFLYNVYSETEARRRAESNLEDDDSIGIDGAIFQPATQPHQSSQSGIGFFMKNKEPKKEPQQPPQQIDDFLRTCENCKDAYQHNHKKQRFCSDACRASFHRKKAK